ncbi:hypothetical protein FRC03_008608 [Tulasnella sp. 419]|nr:hypothetical protein FRC02_009992 [Tulasnella sp. 418]KAG8970411.1 hypothetical protein FRC03_008608 [Tulasnella sp. 419]
MAESAAKRRAAARREAILNSRGDRLAKLTSTARGEDAAMIYDDPPVPSLRSSPANDFLGEEPRSNPKPPSIHRQHSNPPSGGESRGSIPEEVPAWSTEQEQLLMQALMGRLGGGPSAPNPLGMLPGLTPPSVTPQLSGQPPDPFAALLANLQSNGPSDGPQFGPGLGMQNPLFQPIPAPKPKSRLQKLLPLLHITSILCLLAFFVIRYEPSLHATLPDAIPQSRWSRWSDLRWSKGNEWSVQAAPLFYAFTTIQVILHSVRIYSEPPPLPPSGILGLALMNLPPPIPTILSTARKYLSMGGAVMDDLSVLLFAIGFLIWGAGWAVP